MFIQADLGDDGAGNGIGGMEYLDSTYPFVGTEPPRLSSQAEPTIDQVVVDPEWPANVVRRRPTATVRHLRSQSPMNGYEFRRFADLADAIDPFGGDMDDGCCTTIVCWCRQPRTQGGLIGSDDDWN